MAVEPGGHLTRWREHPPAVTSADASHDASQLSPHDFDRALRRMKAELAITELRRRLLDPGLGARAILEITDRVLALQKQR